MNHGASGALWVIVYVGFPTVRDRAVEDHLPNRPAVLIVEDEVLVRTMLSDLLQEAEFKVLEACDADQALEILAARPDVHVVLTDVNMPGLDGLGLARAVAERWPNVSVIISSGRVRPTASELPAGAVFLPKPWVSEALVREVRAGVDRAGAVVRTLNAEDEDGGNVIDLSKRQAV